MLINCHSVFSFKYGTLSLDSLLQTVAETGHQGFFLTDINTTAACLEMARKAQASHISLKVGIDVRNNHLQEFIILCENNSGYCTANAFVSSFLHSGSALPKEAPLLANCYVIYPFNNVPKRKLHDNEWIGVSMQDLSRLPFSPLSSAQYKMVVLQTATFRRKQDYNAHRLLRAIDQNELLSKLPQHQQGSPTNLFIEINSLRAAFASYPTIWRNTEKLFENCNIHFDYGDQRAFNNQRTYLKNHADDRNFIRQLCNDGLAYRYGTPSQEVLKRLEKELRIIEDKQFISYFLINWDIIQYAHRQNYFYVGRGSGANSLVAYLLRITDVDPIELDLYFERFINPSRKNPPDFDMDFSWRDRADITRHIFERFDHATLLGSYNTFQYRSSIREVGKVLGIPKQELDLLSRNKRHAGQNDHLHNLVRKYSQYIEGFPSHPTIHSSGVLIADHSLHQYSTTFLPPKGFATTHFDMHIAEDVGLHKFDILGQRGLAKIKTALEIIKVNKPNAPDFDIHDIEKIKRDKNVNQLLRKGAALGCFYIESPAMRMLMTKLRTDNYLGLVAASSIIRPGVAQSGMMHLYIEKLRNPSKTTPLHPLLDELMKDTFGIMVYQEDVLKVAHFFAGLTLEEADTLRRGMSWKFRERVDFIQVKEAFFTNCAAKGYPDSLTQEVWRQIDSFANYAFAKGHSASYAVESYQCLFLKTYYPLEYMVAVINNGGGFFRPEVYFHEAKLLGGQLHLPCVNHSDSATVLIDRDIYIGLQHIHSLNESVINAIEADRKSNGPFRSFDDFMSRIEIEIESVTSLIRLDAFRFAGKTKKDLTWRAHFLLSKNRTAISSTNLFTVEPKQFTLPSLENDWIEDAWNEIELLGFGVQYSPFQLIDEKWEPYDQSNEWKSLVNQKVIVAGYFIHAKRTMLRKDPKASMFFGLFLDKQGGWIDTVHFPKTALSYPFEGKGCYLIEGKVIDDYDHISLEVTRMRKLKLKSVDRS